jgi:hypothetical protein
MKTYPAMDEWGIPPMALAFVGALLVVLGVALAHGAAAEPGRISQATAVRVPEVLAELGKIHERQGPLGTVRRQLYVPYPRANTSSVISCDYTGACGLRRFERLCYQVHDDVYQDPEIHFSDDNGKTWTPWQADTFGDIARGKECWWQRNACGIAAPLADPESGLLVAVSMLVGHQDGDPRRIGLKRLHYFSFNATSADDGKTWSDWKQLTYEPGPEYSESIRETKEFLGKNQCWTYYNLLALKSGGIVLPVSHVAHLTDEQGKGFSYDCPRCFRGKWRKAKGDYQWTVSEPVTASPKLTGYLEEPWLAELAGGKLLLDMRGTNRGFMGHDTQSDAPGRHWFALSQDHGRTWSAVRDWRYDTGEQFYSPATMAKILRHSQTGKLYWFGNISRTAPSGNSPRYPMVIAQIDEAGPSLKKGTVTVIDDYAPGRDTPAVQFSNFFVFENRQTHEFELYLSPYGQYANVYQANVNKYVIALKEWNR